MRIFFYDSRCKLNLQRQESVGCKKIILLLGSWWKKKRFFSSLCLCTDEGRTTDFQISMFWIKFRKTL